jgi:hypothetical protein
MGLDLNRITEQIYIAKIGGRIEDIRGYLNPYQRIFFEKIYEYFGEKTIITTKKFFKKIAGQTKAAGVECELLVLNKRIRKDGIVFGLEDLRVVSYRKGLGLVDDDQIFLNEYFFEKDGLEEGMPAVLIKDITRKPILLE